MLVQHFIVGEGSAKVIYPPSGNGTIASPDLNEDGLYDFNVDYLWIIEVPDGRIIRYQLQEALIRNSPACLQDGLKVSYSEFGHVMRIPTIRVPTMSDTNWPALSQKMARSLKVLI